MGDGWVQTNPYAFKSRMCEVEYVAIFTQSEFSYI